MINERQNRLPDLARFQLLFIDRGIAKLASWARDKSGTNQYWDNKPDHELLLFDERILEVSGEYGSKQAAVDALETAISEYDESVPGDDTMRRSANEEFIELIEEEIDALTTLD